jgi:hypothetical protein
MLDYTKAELLRFRGWAIAYALLHLAVLAFLSRVVDLAQQPEFFYQCVAGIYAVSGLLLGAYQMGNYRKPNAWINLLHRPVAHHRLAAALMLAALALLGLGVLLPVLLAAAWQEGMTPRVLDLRHLWLAISGWLVAACGYLAGAYAMLADRRHAVAGLILLVGLCFAAASGLAAIVLQLLALAWLVAMVLVAFKPDRAAPPRTIADVALVALPLQMSMWFALLLLSFALELGWIMQGSHPNNLPTLVAGSAKQADNAEARDLMIAGLGESATPEAALWREQAAVSEVHSVSPGLSDLPRPGQLMNPAPMEFDDDQRRVRWVYSHDDARFHGYTIADKRSAGTLGLDGQQPFPLPPQPAGGDLLVSREAVYQFDAESNRLRLRGQLPAGEEIIGLEEAGDRIALLSQRALYLYEKRDLATEPGLLQPRLRVPLPGRPGNLTRVEMMELLDGMLVSFSFTRGRHNGNGRPFQTVLRVDESGRATPVARRDLGVGYGPVFIYSSWYASPLLFDAQRRLTRAFAGYEPAFDVAPPPVPRAAWTIAVALLALSMLLAALRVRRLALPLGGRLAWIAACGLVGLPALMALWLLYPPRERVDADVGRALAPTAAPVAA